MKTPSRTCRAMTKAGTACRSAALTESEYCLFHDPKHEVERREAQSAGGRQRRIMTLPEDAPDVKIENCQDVRDLACQTISQVRRGQIDPRIANAIGYLSILLLRALEQGDVERRLAELEAAVKSQRRVTDCSTSEGL